MGERLKSFGKIRLLFCISAVLLALIIWVVWGNQALELSVYCIESDNLPESFDGYRIAQISDLHNAEMGKENEKIISKLKEAEPDIIVITGDMIDAQNTDTDIALNLARKAVEIAPCYYISGNHEAGVNQYEQFKYDLIQLGVIVLDDDKVKIELGGESISLIGVNDPNFKRDNLSGSADTVIGDILNSLSDEEDGFTVLLSHRPELFDTYVKSNIDLVFSGHAHGGQFRLPFIGGVVAPNQGFFPEYDAGIYADGDTNMVVSRGIGNSIIPFRVNNRPEVVLVELAVRR